MKCSAFAVAVALMAGASNGYACGPDALGTARTLNISGDKGQVYGTAQHGPLPLAKDEVVITFDDGPRPETTPRVLAALKAQCVKATFFMQGNNLTAYPDLARQVVADGHSVGLHSYKHDHMDQLAPADQVKDFDTTRAVAAKVLGKSAAPFYRFPYLGETPDLMNALKVSGYTVFSIDAGANDWEVGETPQTVTDRLMKNLDGKGGIILLHDAQEVTAQAMPLILKTLKDKGYKVVHIEPAP
ncbi:polysaccharide deacetylase family protein [Asticcacaulis sp. ZE23SCel15]|uniref:polysaccharide deacetylase family protein n=1 Tax=Asticcacaulis sp. ZE23SCel15 TaxID=3059027 RepID=UPI00265F8F0C|nr:polysaccharide deacetylase family protein [Asticcacaulis sp. ZE23SCel15]WKL58710.1 polysaccharide deacetylase family protein [Asticcacaulis sp. ZE23SCel15]